MFHFIINFSVITFICYAAAYPAKVILSGGIRTRRAPARRRPRLVVLPRKKAARKELRAAGAADMSMSRSAA